MANYSRMNIPATILNKNPDYNTMTAIGGFQLKGSHIISKDFL